MCILQQSPNSLLWLQALAPAVVQRTCWPSRALRAVTCCMRYKQNMGQAAERLTGQLALVVLTADREQQLPGQVAVRQRVPPRRQRERPQRDRAVQVDDGQLGGVESWRVERQPSRDRRRLLHRSIIFWH